MTKVVARIGIRPYTDADEDAVIGLLTAALGVGPAGERPAEFFRWKHQENPFGRSFGLVAEADDRIVGLRAFMRWEFVAGGRRFRAVRAVDTATHPDYQGRGIFSQLTLEALDALPHEADFVFNTPNEKSLPGYLKMGWRVVGQVPIRVRVRRPIHFAVRARSWKPTADPVAIPTCTAPLASALLTDEVEGLLQDQGGRSDRISTPRDMAYLRWRYGRAPLLGYRAVEAREEGQLEALSIFRIRPRGELVECTVAETIVRAENVRAGARVLRHAGSSAAIDHLTYSFPAGTAAGRAALRAGSVRVPRGMTLVVNTLGHRLDPDPLDLRSWAVSVGDLEVF